MRYGPIFLAIGLLVGGGIGGYVVETGARDRLDEFRQSAIDAHTGEWVKGEWHWADMELLVRDAVDISWAKFKKAAEEDHHAPCKECGRLLRLAEPICDECYTPLGSKE